MTGPGGKETSPTAGTDRKLAQNAQMYHYQHQKQQMIAFDRFALASVFRSQIQKLIKCCVILSF